MFPAKAKVYCDGPRVAQRLDDLQVVVRDRVRHGRRAADGGVLARVHVGVVVQQQLHGREVPALKEKKTMAILRQDTERIAVRKAPLAGGGPRGRAHGVVVWWQGVHPARGAVWGADRAPPAPSTARWTPPSFLLRLRWLTCAANANGVAPFASRQSTLAPSSTMRRWHSWQSAVEAAWRSNLSTERSMLRCGKAFGREKLAATKWTVII